MGRAVSKVTKVLLYSGGMDSMALRMLWDPNVSVYVDMGTAYSKAERDRLPRDVDVVELPLHQWERTDGIIPLRNLMLVCVAAQYGDVIGLAATAGDRVLDKSDQFASMTTSLLSYLWSPQHWTAGEHRRVVLPLKGMSKRQIVGEVRERFGDVGLVRLAESWSCYSGGRAECGACKPCMRKWVAFAAAGAGDLVMDASGYVYDEVLPLIAQGVYDRGSEARDVLDALGATDADDMQAAELLLAGRA
jgi:7-cyano-7-deazaguanine synthase in queuosine biosynthesis